MTAFVKPTVIGLSCTTLQILHTCLSHMIAFFALVALTLAFPGGHEGGGDKATEVIHGHPVVTGVFKNPGIGYYNNYAPKIEGPVKHRGQGPHIEKEEHH
ncbi:uncharacterized protein LOC125505851 isoform X2 [Dendroctonus ponderosae]|uniref:uncharacterized protein LOC125505851 isoform X2 n=1 Tax=Dendroctonus ponderosae TaxID=77166 RepID=UPI0020363476|nr:uncharacterized protein LOC125505851 isoform X2 [Dendroctonus ponderosae]